MKQLLGVALAAGLAFVPVMAKALDTAQGVVRSADVLSGVLVISTDGDNAREMSFNVSEKVNFYELFLEPGDRVSVEFDASECPDGNGCMPIAQNIVPVS